MKQLYIKKMAKKCNSGISLQIPKNMCSFFLCNFKNQLYKQKDKMCENCSSAIRNSHKVYFFNKAIDYDFFFVPQNRLKQPYFF